MKPEYLNLSEGVAYNENAMPEECYWPDIATEIDEKNGWKEPGEVSEVEARQEAIDALGKMLEWLTAMGSSPLLIEQRMILFRVAGGPLAVTATKGLLGWIRASGKNPILLKQRVMAALYVMRPALLNPRTGPKIAAQLGIQKQRFFNHVKDFRRWSGIHKFERPLEARERMAAAARKNWQARKAPAASQS